MTLISNQIKSLLSEKIAMDWERVCLALDILPREIKNISTGRCAADLSTDFIVYLKGRETSLEDLQTAIGKICCKRIQVEVANIITHNSINVFNPKKGVAFNYDTLKKSGLSSDEYVRQIRTFGYIIKLTDYLCPGITEENIKLILKDERFDTIFNQRSIQYLMKIFKIEDKDKFMNLDNATMILIFYYLQRIADSHLYIQTNVSFDDIENAYLRLIAIFPRPTEKLIKELVIQNCDEIISKLYTKKVIPETQYRFWRDHPAKIIIVSSLIFQMTQDDIVKAVSYFDNESIILSFNKFDLYYLQEALSATIIPENKNNDFKDFLKLALGINDIDEYYNSFCKEEVTSLEEMKDVLNSEDCNLFLTRIPNMTIGKIRKLKNAINVK